MTAEKDVQVARKKGRGGGGGEVIRAMPERKHFFYRRASLTEGICLVKMTSILNIFSSQPARALAFFGGMGANLFMGYKIITAFM